MLKSEQEIKREQVLVERAKANRKEFRHLYEKFYRQIFGFIFNRTENEAATADICSQTFLKAMINLPKYEYRGLPFSAWLYRIALNEVNLYFRSNKRSRVVSVEENSLPEIIEEIDEKDSEENRELLLESLQELSSSEIELVELRYFELRSVREVSVILGITEANVKVKSHRVVKKLKGIMINLRGR